MGSLVKLKLILVGGCFVALAVLLLEIDTRIDPASRFKEWSPDSSISPSDFLQEDPWFEIKYAASIRSIVIIHIDSTGVSAKTMMDKHSSWYDQNDHSWELLKHEGYHIYLTSVATQIINSEIKNHNLTYDEAASLRDSLSPIIWELQEAYDDETNHGLDTLKQKEWEIKIDSLYHL